MRLMVPTIARSTRHSPDHCCQSRQRMVTVMVITCPHALGLAVPLVVAVSTRLTAQNGLLIRDRAAFERARNLGAVLFDKTGTLTEGRFGVSGVVLLAELGRRRSTGVTWWGKAH